MVAKRTFLSTFLFLFLTLFIHESSGFMLSHTHSESRKRHLSNNLFAPNENVIFKNYAQTFMKSDQEQFIFSQAASNTTTEEYVDVPVESLPEELTDEEEKQKAMQDYEDDILNCTLLENDDETINEKDETSNNTLSENEESKEKTVKENIESSEKKEKTESESKSEKNDENLDWKIEYKNSTENQTNETESEVEENEVDYSFNISEYAYESLDEWDDRENNSNQTTTSEASIENQEDENQFLRTYDESYLNETDNETNETENGNSTLSEEEREAEGEKFLKKEELDKMGKYLPGDDFLLNYTAIDNQNKSNTEYNTIKNDTQLEKDLKSILNFEHDKDIIS